MKTAKQFTFGSYVDEFKDYWKESNRRVHGGEHAIGKRKTASRLAQRSQFML
jgi:hypothetical protein